MISKEQIIEAAAAHAEFSSPGGINFLIKKESFIAGAEYVQSQPVIKPLEWEEGTGNWKGDIISRPLFSLYNIDLLGAEYTNPGYRVLFFQDESAGGYDDLIGEGIKTLEEAKSAAQSHYESRIKECLI